MNFNIHRFREVGVKIVVDVSGDNKLKNLSKLVEQTDNKTVSFKNKIKDIKVDIDDSKLRKMPSLLGKVEKGFRSLSLVRLTYLTNAIRRVTSGLVDMVENAAGYEESLNLYRMALGKYIDAASGWSSEIQEKLLIDETELMQATGTFFNLARGLGVASDSAFTMSQALTQLTYDMSSYLNISVEAANTKIQSAMSGQARAIQSVGVAIQVASLQELAYSLGIKKSVSEMTQAEKTYLRYIQLMKSTTHMQGDLARTMITPANSVRILKTQINLLGRAIGQALTPIIMEVIPWIMAFTKVLTNLAKKIADALGYQVSDVDYSTAFIDGADAVEDYGNTVSKAGNKVKRSLAPFDELNVVTSTSGSGGSGLSNSIIADLEKYVKSYDMLAGYTDELKKKAESLEAPANNILKIMGTILGGMFIGKLISKIWDLAVKTKTLGNNLKNLFSKFKKLDIVKKTSSLIKTLGSNFKNFISQIKNRTKPWEAFSNTFGTVGKVFTGASLAITEFIAVFKHTDAALRGTESLNEAIGKTAVTTGLLATAAGLLIGSTGVFAVLGAGALAAGVAVGKYHAELKTAEEQEKQMAINAEVRKNLNDGLGVSFIALSNAVNNYNNGISANMDELDKQYEKYVTSTEAVGNADIALRNLVNAIGAQNEAMTQTQWTDYLSKYEELKTAIEISKADTIGYATSIINSYTDINEASANSVAERIANIKMLESAEAGYELEYLEREKKIVEDFLKKKISLDEYNAKIAALQAEYGKTSNVITDVNAVIEDFKNKIKDIDFKNMSADELSQKLKEVGTSSQETVTKIENAKKSAVAFFKEQINESKKTVTEMETLHKRQGYLTDEQQARYDNAKQQIIAYTDEMKIAVDGYDAEIRQVRSTMKDFLAIVYADLLKNGADTSTEFNGVINTIKGTLEALGDVDLTDAGKSTLETYLKGVSTEYTKGEFESKFKELFRRLGDGGLKHIVDGIANGEYKFRDQLKKSAGKMALDTLTGYKEGIENNSNKATDAVEDVAEDSINVFRVTLDSHSPSRVFRSIGRDTIEGFVLGVEEKAPDAIKSIQSLADNVSKAMKDTKLSLNVDTNVEKSFNSILTKLQNFCNKWTSAVNTLVGNMKSTMNGITINADGKVSYTKMPKVTVSKFEDGGYPTSGELFFANENGRAEFITSIGNKTAVANQDQMVQALTNAIMAGFAMTSPRGESKQPINVNIGNERVYSGVIDYQNRQSDRYGTTTTINV